jgi:DNA-binding NarL/FixJ family response regulator
MMTEPRTAAVRVMLVDDHQLVRHAVRQAISAPGIEVVGEVASAEEALTVAIDVRPDLVFVDIGLPAMSGLDLVRELAPRLPDTRFIVLTVSTADTDVADAMQHGASGFLTKGVAPDALLRAVHGAMRGDLVMPRQMAARLVRTLGERVRHVQASAAWSGSEMSPRETEVLRLVADGYTDREIARTLTLSIRTVESHVSNLLRKLDVANRREAGRRYRAFA